MLLIYIVITCFIKYELDEFELNNEYLRMVWCRINVCEWYGMVIETQYLQERRYPYC